MKPSRWRVLVTVLASIAAGSVLAQPPQPAPPGKYQVTLRYRITSARDQHVQQYDALVEDLRKLGFEFQPPLEDRPDTDREDRSKNTFHGLVPSKNALQLLANPNVAAVQLIPEGFKLDADPNQIVRVRLELAGGLPQARQLELSEQVKAILRDMEFREAVGYDHRGYMQKPFTRLMGTIPIGRMEILLKDLRGQPAGWFAPRLVAEDIPTPLRNVSPIRVIEVLADPEPILDEPPPLPRSPEYLEKITPDLWALVEAKGQENQIIRVQLIFVGALAAEDTGWRAALQEASPGIFIEGQLSQNVTALVRVGDVKALAALPQVSVLRLPPPARVDIEPAVVSPGNNAKALSQSGAAALHAKGFQGQGVRLALIDTDFRGWNEMVKAGKLPASTRLVDLTRERSPVFEPLPWPGKGRIGHGTQCALAAVLAAPRAELTLIRTDAWSDYQLNEILGYFQGGPPLSAHMDRRRDELASDRAELQYLRDIVQKERAKVLDDFTDETDLERDFGFLGPVYGWVFSTRSWNRDRMAYLEKQEANLKERIQNFFSLIEQIQALRTAQLVSCSLAWNDGYPVGGASALSRSLEQKLGPKLQWFQSAGNTRGQAWAGLYRDDNGNGVMEFAPEVPKGARGDDAAPWSNELAFLSWQPHNHPIQKDLTPGVTLRLTLQWREPHDPDYFLKPGEEDFYRKPLAQLRLLLLRQRDPGAAKLPADAFEVVARSADLPQRLEHMPGGSIYEQALEWKVDKPGRYALRVERDLGGQWVLVNDPAKRHARFVKLPSLQASGLRPVGAATLPLLEKQWELQPRLFVGTAGLGSLYGRPLFTDFATDQGSIGLPGDSRGVVTVGAADISGKAQAYSAPGPLAYAELSRKPALLTFDALDVGQGGAYGTSVATPFAAGMAASLLSSGMPREQFLQILQQPQGQLWRLP